MKIGKNHKDQEKEKTMPKITYQKIRFHVKRQNIIHEANEIISEYQADNYDNIIDDL